MKLSPTIFLLALVLGGLSALIGYGARSYHPIISFVLMFGFVLGVGSVVNGLVDKSMKAFRKR